MLVCEDNETTLKKYLAALGIDGTDTNEAFKKLVTLPTKDIVKVINPLIKVTLREQPKPLRDFFSKIRDFFNLNYKNENISVSRFSKSLISDFEFVLKIKV